MERPEFSEELASRRRQLGFSTTQASRVLRLKEDVLIAFEEGDFDAMPKSGYAQGMLSSYARYLGLDAARIVEMYAEELETWRREGSGRSRGNGGRGQRAMRSTGPGQPYVPARGLLPTSGGPAGDMGSFATTRVRTRGNDGYESPESRGYSDDYGHAYGEVGRNRPYTSRAPEPRSRTREGSQSWDDIQTRGVGRREYEDDLRIGMQAQSYESASSSAGRRSSRNISGGNRQRVRQRPGSRTGSRQGSRSGSRSRDGRSSRRRGSGSRGTAQLSMQSFVIIVAAIAVMSVLLVVSITSCVNSNFGTNRTEVPVNTTPASETSSSRTEGTSSAAGGTSTSAGTATEGARQTDSQEGSGTSKKRGTSTDTDKARGKATVDVTVADGAVTWLEVECDGTSEIAEQVTGPWAETYTVEESLLVQASDTTAVTVEQDGKLLEFDSSKASGIGTIRIEVERSSATTSSKSGKSSASGDAQDEYAQDEAEDSSLDAAPSERTSGSKSSSGSSSARMGNNASTDEESEEDPYSSKNESGDGYGYDTYDEYGSY